MASQFSVATRNAAADAIETAIGATPTLEIRSGAAPAGLVIDSQSSTATSTTVWLSGGTAGRQVITNTITTNGGRTFERSVEMIVGQM